MVYKVVLIFLCIVVHYFRKGMSLPHVTREMCNVWKCDHTIASVVLKESLGEFVANVMGWSSVRMGQDDLIWKPPRDTACSSSSSVVGFHQDAAYISCQFEPLENNSVTLWMALDNADEETGCVQYVPGSHLWRPLAYLVSNDLARGGRGVVGRSIFHCHCASAVTHSCYHVRMTTSRPLLWNLLAFMVALRKLINSHCQRMPHLP